MVLAPSTLVREHPATLIFKMSKSWYDGIEIAICRFIRWDFEKLQEVGTNQHQFLPGLLEDPKWKTSPTMLGWWPAFFARAVAGLWNHICHYKSLSKFQILNNPTHLHLKLAVNTSQCIITTHLRMTPSFTDCVLMKLVDKFAKWSFSFLLNGHRRGAPPQLCWWLLSSEW